MTVTKYEKKFTSLSYFVDTINLSNYQKARMFEIKLYPRYKNLVSSHRLPTLRAVVESSRVF